MIEQIAYNIKFLREQKNWTQQKLADQLMISRSTVTKWENSQLTPDIQSLIKLSSVFDITLDNLVGNYTHHKELMKEFKRIYRSKSIEFDDEAVELVEYMMKFPELKEQVYRLQQLSIKKQMSIQKLLRSLIDQYEQI
ncbi:helix-turn-helix domain-containing protein [Oceanobacillus alkalisoli]|uniref:helix-turn-helix domain-containing protein n=1 Tax=Oceanobacillus alkalisoli TaxID=2925113 RepID=UPI001F120E09|nr:helix-turn-helix transcriptional regulator [Oceanobacillus alkalisoli]MCF3943618.1 helix-turn-helix transcriptional regulator [Oceanobacillus alkalisoli]